MAPNSQASTMVVTENVVQEDTPKPKPYKMELKYTNIVLIIVLHLMALKGLLIVFDCHIYTLVKFVLHGYGAGLGVTAGAHRLWTHRSYKARLPLRIFLAFLGVLGVQDSIYIWVRDHRVHHKFSETDADPHNIKRGIFFAHVGWLMCKKHPDVIEKGKSIDLSDLEADPVIVFQRNYYNQLAIIFGVILPIFVPWYFWNETLSNAFFLHVLEYVTLLNATWSVNSLAHMFGSRPYDKEIHASENRLVSFWALGEGFHNYHHAFPWDYSTSEWRYTLNITTLFIDTMTLLGLAYDRKSVPVDQVRRRMMKSGDHSHEY